jgi:hypothetical protein
LGSSPGTINLPFAFIQSGDDVLPFQLSHFGFGNNYPFIIWLRIEWG